MQYKQTNNDKLAFSKQMPTEEFSQQYKWINWQPIPLYSWQKMGIPQFTLPLLSSLEAGSATEFHYEVYIFLPVVVVWSKLTSSSSKLLIGRILPPASPDICHGFWAKLAFSSFSIFSLSCKRKYGMWILIQKEIKPAKSITISAFNISGDPRKKWIHVLVEENDL